MNKILMLFSDIFPLGGIQQYNKALCDALEDAFAQHTFIALSFGDLPEKHAKRWYNIDIKAHGHIKPRFIAKFAFFINTILAVIVGKPVFLVCGHIALSPIALFLKKVCRLRYIVLTYGIDVWDLKNGIKYKALKNADAIITISRYTKTRMISNGIDSQQIKMLRSTVNTSLFYPKDINQNLLNRLHLKNKRVLLTVSRISKTEKYKGHDTMLEVMQKLSNEYVWLSVGSGNYLPSLKNKAKQLGLDKKIIFLDNIEKNQLIDCYNLCNAFILPSKGEGFGIVFLEALACGKPVIGGNKDGSTDPLMEGRLGFLVDPDNVEEITKTINLVCTTKEDRTNAEYLRKHVEENFGVDIFNHRAKEIFSNIII